MYKVQLLNNIASVGLKQFPAHLYEVATAVQHPDIVLVRSADLHQVPIPESVMMVGRAGIGTNNIPVAALTLRGIPVFTAPGANANAVREAVIAGMLIASRNICQAWEYVSHLTLAHEALSAEVEKAKKRFVGFELAGKTLGIIGLGSIGVKVANAALALGMNIIGYDNEISVNRAWELSSSVERAHDINTVLVKADFVSLHVPLTEGTKHLINASRIAMMKERAILLNFARDEIVDNQALLSAFSAGKILSYVCDFPSAELINHPRVIYLPHLGASTEEAEENCAIQIVKQAREFVECGAIHNAVNFPSVDVPALLHGSRIIIVNQNIPNMVAQITSKLGLANLNILDLINKSRDEIAYTLIDITERVHASMLNEIAKIDGVIRVRAIIASPGE